MDRFAKAIVAALVGGYALFQVATGSGSPGGEGVTSAEWVGVVATVVILSLGVWAVPNTPALPVPVPVLPPPDAVTTVNVNPSPAAPFSRPGMGDHT